MKKNLSCFCFILCLVLITLCGLHAQTVDESALASGPGIANDADETTIAVNPLDADNVIAGAIDRRQGSSRCGAYTSFDGGQTWTQQLLGLPAQLGDDPAVTFDSYGNAYYVCLNRAGDRWINVYRSSDSGRTWSTARTVASSPVCLDKPNITADPGIESMDGSGNPVNAVYVTWTCTGNPTSNIYFSKSVNGGETWLAGFQINESFGENQGSQPAVDNSGNIIVAWHNRDQSTLLMTAVDPATQSTGGEVVITGQPISQVGSVVFVEGQSQRFRTNSWPSIAFDRSWGPNDGRLYVAWAGLRDGDGSVIYETSTTDLGATWQPPVVLNPNPPGNYVQIFPFVSVTGDGTVLTTFYDSEGDTRAVRRLRYWGALFSGEISAPPSKFMISNPPTLWTDPLIGPPGFIGDYTGNSCMPDRPLLCYGAWTGHANPNTQDVYVGRIRR